ncbi:agouti-related protein [Osmerus mordax]|uniref:agouti-related protein n=1 Tax=Osmerus mordax TaxID=8014 RepID=UPI00350F0DA7
MEKRNSLDYREINFGLLHSVSMLNSMILFWWTLNLIHMASGLVHGNMRLDDTHPSLRRSEDSFLPDIGKSSVSSVDPVHFRTEFEEEQMMVDTGSYDEDVAEAVQLQSRAMRSPRRCIPHFQFCQQGHHLPCCEPCDTCHCRFYGAYCSCRRVGQDCTHGRT